jgi:hypothetical protein
VAFFWHCSREIVTLISQEGCPGEKLISFGFIRPLCQKQTAKITTLYQGNNTRLSEYWRIAPFPLGNAFTRSDPTAKQTSN